MADIALAFILMIGGAWLMLALAGLALVVVGVRGALPTRDRRRAAARQASPARKPITVGEYVESAARGRDQGAGRAAWSSAALRARPLDPIPGLRA